MQVLRKIASLLFLLTSLAVAHGQAPATAPSSGSQKATIYVYRYKQFVGSALAPSVYCDEAQLARMENGRYFAVTIDPGQHAFRSNDAQSGIQLDVKPGEEYFIRLEIATGMMKGHGRLVLTASEQGRYELQSNKLKPLDASKVTDHARVSVEEAKFDKPTATAAPAAPAATLKPAVAVQTPSPSQNSEPEVREVTLSDGTPDAASNQTSLGDAARKARQKKAPGDSATPVQK